MFHVDRPVPDGREIHIEIDRANVGGHRIRGVVHPGHVQRANELTLEAIDMDHLRQKPTGLVPGKRGAGVGTTDPGDQPNQHDQ